jgi:hypothetical protein
MGVPQGSSEGGNTWLVIFDILLTMLKLRHVSRLHIQDTQGELRPQNPTAFADDLLTYDPDQEGVQLHADVISFFCMMTWLEIAPSKMVARATNVQSEAGHLSLNLWTINGERVQVPIEHDPQEDSPSLLRYLGVHVEPDLSWRGQYEKLRVKTENLTRILSTSRASTSIKWYAMAMCGFAALTYPAKYAP